MCEIASLAPQVCFHCKLRKRKCSKELPSCALCTKSSVECDYYYGSLARQLHLGRTLFSSTESSDQRYPSLTDHIPVQTSSAKTQQSSVNSLSPRPPVLSGGEITDQVLDLLFDNGESIPSVTAVYFRTIDVWLPVISRERIQVEFGNIRTASSGELAILLLCMYLITRVPSSVEGAMLDMPLYREAKLLQSAQASSGDSGIETVQAGLLLCLYEQGHGFFDAAQLSMATVSRLGIRMINAYRKRGFEHIQNTEVGHLWWGIEILDKFMNLGVDPQDIHLSTGTRGDRNLRLELPYDPEALLELKKDDPVLQGPSGVFVNNPMTKLGPFCRTAEAARILGRVFELTTQSTSTIGDVELEQLHTLDIALQECTMSLMKQASNGWEECCAAIGLCFGGLFTLHKKNLEVNLTKDPTCENIPREGAVMALKTAVRMTIDISEHFYLDRAYIDLQGLALPATFAIYEAALLHIRLNDDRFRSKDWSSDMESLRNTLRYFGKRWDVGRKYLAIIDKVIDDEKQKRLQTV